MRKSLLVLSAVLTAFSISTADAATKKKTARKKAKPVTAIAAPVIVKSYDWSGAYIGAHAGYAFASSSKFDKTINSAVGDINTILTNAGLPNMNVSKNSMDGFQGGLYAGYNYMMNQTLIGGEVDINFGELKKSTTASYSNAGATVNIGAYYKQQVSGSARVRLGYSFDNILPYLTTGLAVANTKAGINYNWDDGTGAGNTGAVSLSKSKTIYGLAVGAGVEYAITKNIVGRVEYIYTNYGSTKYGDNKLNLNTNTVRAGLSYKF